MKHPCPARGFPRLSTLAKCCPAHLAVGAAEVEPLAAAAEAEPHAAAMEVVMAPRASAAGGSWVADRGTACKSRQERACARSEPSCGMERLA